MKYQPPVGAADPNAPYIDGNPLTGTEGSAVPARAIEHPMREILNVILLSGLSPDENDLDQLAEAIYLIAAAASPTVSGFTVGDVKPAFKAAADAGWLSLNGDTIGKAGSGATQANAIYETLFKHLWTVMANAEAPVSGGRGASAQADWDAGKTLKLVDARGRAPYGAGTGAGLTLNLPLGGLYGEEKHILTVDEMPPHNHNVTSGNDTSNGGLTPDMSASVPNKSFATQSTGGGQGHNTVPPVFAVNWFIKY